MVGHREYSAEDTWELSISMPRSDAPAHPTVSSDELSDIVSKLGKALTMPQDPDRRCIQHPVHIETLYPNKKSWFRQLIHQAMRLRRLDEAGKSIIRDYVAHHDGEPAFFLAAHLALNGDSHVLDDVCAALHRSVYGYTREDAASGIQRLAESGHLTKEQVATARACLDRALCDPYLDEGSSVYPGGTYRVRMTAKFALEALGVESVRVYY